MFLVDTHAHLNDVVFNETLPDLLCDMQNAGIVWTLCPAVDTASSIHILDLVKRFPVIRAAVGVHPNNCAQEIRQLGVFWSEIESLAQNADVVAIGETGLDLYWDDTPLDTQILYFQRHLDLSRKTGKPVIIHCRDAWDVMLKTLWENYSSHGPFTGVIHSFSGDSTQLKNCLDLGFYISYSGLVTYTNKKLAFLRDTVKLVPEERLLVETDSPYLAPHPLRGKISFNTPEHLYLVADAVAKLRNITTENVALITTQNANRLFAHKK